MAGGTEDGGRISSPVSGLLGCIVAAVLFLLLLGGWQVAATLARSAATLPPPADVFASLAELLDQRLLWQATIATARSWAGAAVLAALAAIVLGLAIGSSRGIGALLTPSLVLFGAFPVPVLAALLVLWLGLGTALGAILTGALLALFPMVAIIAHARRRGAALNGVFHALQVGAVLTLFGVLFAEAMAGRGRLGSMVLELVSTLETKRLFALVLFLWAMGLAAALPCALARWLAGGGR
jgi:ABC-type nitrate/sulfonate/bicarbonate transport system permease component